MHVLYKKIIKVFYWQENKVFNYEKKYLLKIIFAYSFLLVGQGSANELPDFLRKAYNDTNYEVSECLAFYTFVWQCTPENSPERIKGQKIVEEQTGIAILVGQEAGMSNDAINSRVLMQISEMRKLVNGECINIASLLNRYKDKCVRVRTNFSSIVDGYVEKYKPK